MTETVVIYFFPTHSLKETCHEYARFVNPSEFFMIYFFSQNRNANTRQGINRQSGGGLGMMNPLAMMVQQNLGGLLGCVQ
jgi:hypothetical protein